MPSAKKTPELLSIGEISRATGLSPDTIRVWERRYGLPKAVRLPSGHRRYAPEELGWLRRVVEAVALGERPGRAVKRSREELDALIEERVPASQPPEDLSGWLELLRRFDGVELTRLLRTAYDRDGVSSFLKDTVSPLLIAVGRAWSEGRIGVRHEHFLTEVLQDLLRSLRVTIGEPSRGPQVLFASLEGDLHDLPLQMGALLAAEKGLRPRLVGRDAPQDEIIRAAVEMRVDGIAVPIPHGRNGGTDQEERIDGLRAALPHTIGLCVGWHGSLLPRRPRKGVRVVRELGELELWLRELL